MVKILKYFFTCLVIISFLIPTMACTTSQNSSNPIKQSPPTSAPIKPLSPATETPPTPPPSSPQTPPPPAPEVIPPKVSFSAKTYTNSEYKFSFLYPDNWVQSTPIGYNVFATASPAKSPGVYVAVYETAKLNDQIAEHLKLSGGSNSIAGDSQDITLADGKTKGKLSKSTFKIFQYNFVGLSLFIEKGDKTIGVSYSNPQSNFNEEAAKEILSTVIFK